MMLTTLHYRPLYAFLSRLRQAGIQFIGSSATILPISMIEKLITLAQFTPSTTKLIRAPTFRPEIVYSAFELQQHPRPSAGRIGYIDHGGNNRSLLDYVQDIVTNFRSEERALVFCLTKNEAEEIAKLLGCEFYHAGLPVIERQDVGTRWRSGRYKLLATTSAFGAGIDYSEVKLVVHYGRPRNIIDYSQESGRAGRSIPRAYSTVFYDPSRREERLVDGQDNSGIQEMKDFVMPPTCKCRRMSLGSLDGKPASCFQLKVVALCDLCELRLQRDSLVSLLTFEIRAY
jgi:superfamily II DNA helicase RecQ